VVLDAINNRMKLVAALFICLIAVSLCSAQQNRVNLQQKIVLTSTTIRFDSLLSIVGRQTGARFSLNTSKFPPSRLVHLSKGPMPVAQLLAEIRSNTGIYYTILGSHIIFIDNPPCAEKKMPVRKMPVKKPLANKITPASLSQRWDLQPLPAIYFVTDSLEVLTGTDSVKTLNAGLIRKNNPADTLHNRLLPWQLRVAMPQGWGGKRSDSLYNKITTIGFADTVKNVREETPAITAKNETIKHITSAQKDTAAVNNTIKRPTTASQEKTSAIKTFLENTFSNRYQKAGGQGVRGPSPFSFLLNTGMTADDVFYVNPTIQMGFPFLYGIASWSSNFRVSGLRWGGGISARIAEDWRLHLQATTGKQQEQSFDSIELKRSASSRLFKISLLAERKINERFRVQAGIVFNNLLIRYTQDGKPATFSEAKMAQLYEELNFIRPLYTLTNTYGEGRNAKSWIGIQVGIFYNINFRKR
jgi:hypothetical protein